MLCKIAIIYYASKPGKHWLCKADNGNAVETLSGISGVHRADKEFPCNTLIVIEAAVGFLHSKTVWGWQKVYKNFPLQCWAIAAFVQWLLAWVSVALRALTQNLWALAQILMNI